MKFFAYVLACIATLILTACSGTPQPTATVTVPGPTVTVMASESETPPTSAENDQVSKTFRASRIKWANDPNRAVLFRDYPKAATLVARALAYGKFGSVEKYNEWKTELMPGQTGWGGIAANSGGDATADKPGAFAWVYYRADGSIDWSKGVRDFGIDMGPTQYGLDYFRRDIFDNRFKHSISLDIKTDSKAKFYSTCFTICVDDPEYSVATRDISQLVEVETSAAKALDANLTALYGPKWRSRTT